MTTRGHEMMMMALLDTSYSGRPAENMSLAFYSRVWHCPKDGGPLKIYKKRNKKLRSIPILLVPQLPAPSLDFLRSQLLLSTIKVTCTTYINKNFEIRTSQGCFLSDDVKPLESIKVPFATPSPPVTPRG